MVRGGSLALAWLGWGWGDIGCFTRATTERKLSGFVANYLGISYSCFYNELMYISMSVLHRYTVYISKLITCFNPLFVSINKVSVLMTVFWVF